MKINRRTKDHIEKVLKDTPVVLLSGSRQSGKSTLAGEFSNNHATLDDYSVLDAIQSDPEGYLQSRLNRPQGLPFVLDEAQLSPQLFRPLKKIIDECKKPGLMILTGSANLLSWNAMPDSLVGRMESIELFPFSLSEVTGITSRWIDDIFDKTDINKIFQHQVSQADYEYFLMSGGFPEAFARKDEDRRDDWLRNYVHNLIEKDARILGNIESSVQLYRLISLIANQVGSTLNQTNLAQKTGISRPTALKYLRCLELLYLITFVYPWHKNLNKRLVKSPKVYLNDTGVLRYLWPTAPQAGALVEQHVLCELRKQISFSKTKASLYFYRTTEDAEIDFILEHRDGRLVCIEVKAAHQVTKNDFRHLITFKQENPEKFVKGLVLYQGNDILPFGDGLFAIPLRYLV